MNLNIIRPKNETEGLLLSITKNCERLIEPTHRKAEGTLKFRVTKSRKKFHFIPPIQIERDWMIGLTSLEVYNSIFNITEQNNKFKLYTGHLESVFSYTEMKKKVAEVLGLSDLYPTDLEHEKDGPNFIKIYRKLSIEKSQTDGFFIKEVFSNTMPRF